MTVATTTPDGRPAARIVLLKGVDPVGAEPRGFVFYTNTESRKADELSANPRTALLFHWKSLGRQIRIEGRAQPASPAEADAYFASRARISRLGAWASDQSRPLADRAELERRLAEYEARYSGERHSPPAALGRLSRRARTVRVLAGDALPAARSHHLHASAGWSLDDRQAVSIAAMNIPPAQQEVVAFLRGLTDTAPVETHISLVFLGADTVWKLKKAVRLPFLDFTDVAARRHFAERELVLNGPAAAGLYRDVVAVVRQADGRLGFSDRAVPGMEAIDWVLRMARIPAGDFLDAMAAAAPLEPPMLDALADAVAAYHAHCPIADVDVARSMHDVTSGNARSARHAGLPEPIRVAEWERAVSTALELALRVAAGTCARGLRAACPWRPSSRQFVPLAGQARSIRCARVRRAHGHHRSWL